MKKYLLMILAVLYVMSAQTACASDISAAYEMLTAYKTENYPQQSVADFNNSLLDKDDFSKLLDAHSDVITNISPDDDNYNFITLTLNALLNEIYYEQVEKILLSALAVI